MSKTKTVGNDPLNTDQPAHEPVKAGFLDNFLSGDPKNPTYKASEGADKMTRCGTITAFSTTLVVGKADEAVMNYCELLETPTLSHYMFTAIFNGLKTVVLRDLKEISLTTKGANIKCFETNRFLFIEQNKNKSSKFGHMAKNGAKIMWIIRKEDNTYIGRVQNGTLYRNL